MKTLASIALAFMALLVFSQNLYADAASEQQALTAAEAWLHVLDAGDYSQSWESAASLFKKQMTKEQWESMVSGARDTVGAVMSRNVQSKHFTKNLPGAPDGEYVVIEFKTSFASKQSAVEMVTPMRDKDGSWRVSSYLIR